MTFSKFLLGIMIVGIFCGCAPSDHTKLGKYELSTDEMTARHQCRTFFKQFHGQYRKRKTYGRVWKESTLSFYGQPNCGAPCNTDEIYWECYFKTSDDDRGFMIFSSRIFTDET